MSHSAIPAPLAYQRLTLKEMYRIESAVKPVESLLATWPSTKHYEECEALCQEASIFFAPNDTLVSPLSFFFPLEIAKSHTLTKHLDALF